MSASESNQYTSCRPGLLAILRAISRRISNALFYLFISSKKRRQKIIYLLTPPSRLRNVGDHAQVLGIMQWVRDYFNGWPVFEFDKDQVYKFLPAIRQVTNDDDLIFLHSGGNIGDQSMWSERARRLIIESFPRNKIVSLPQTIYFTNSDAGRREMHASSATYGKHSNLTLIARDRPSLDTARKIFGKARLLLCPDFVFYLSEELSSEMSKMVERKGAVLSLRRDYGSTITEENRQMIVRTLREVGRPYAFHDTRLSRGIPRRARAGELRKMLRIFEKAEIVITDRVHGAIFSAITKTPCVLLPSDGPRMEGIFDWLKELNYVWFARDFSQLKNAVQHALRCRPAKTIDWNARYFAQLKKQIFDENGKAWKEP